LLCLSQSFAPDTTPTAIRASKLLEELSDRWEISVVTEAAGPHRRNGVRVEVARGWQPRRLFGALQRLRLSKLLELFVWPDESIFWTIPAILTGRRLIRERAPSAIVVFMMPYSAGLAGIALSRLSGVPLILNFDDSPTCSDMHPYFPTRLHYRLAKALEDLYVRSADAIVYVSQTNLDAVRSRHTGDARRRFHLVRYGADPAPIERHAQPANPESFEITYVGAMSGWLELIEQDAPLGRLRRLYRAWTRLGRYERTTLDQRTHSPAIVGGAVQEAIREHADWAGRLSLTLHGDPYPAPIVAHALARAGVEDVVNVLGPVAHEQVAAILSRADLLLLTLPARLDGSRGGRISAKTYEYLSTDRPILAAVPRGENWDYLADKPGVWLVEPDDRQRMTEVIAELAEEKFAGRPRSFDRTQLQAQQSYAARAAELENVIRAGVERRLGAAQ
jgi:hypothetical protein